MSDHTLRRQTVDLYAEAESIREGDLADARERKREFESEVAKKYDGYVEVPASVRETHEQLKQQIRELEGDAQTLEHYADEWTDWDAEPDRETCPFVLEELNGDEWAATVDAVNDAVAEGGSVPEGLGRVKGLEYGVEDIPAGWPADPGQWPAAVVNTLFTELEDLTAPRGVDLGNDSLASVFDGESTDATATATPPDGN